MENIRKQRKYARSHATKLLSKTTDLLTTEDIIKLQVFHEQLQEKRTELKALDTQFLNLTTDKDDEIEKEIEIADNYQERILDAMKRVELKLTVNERKSKEAPAVLESADTEEKQKSRMMSARLPKIDLPTFSGDINTWLCFWQNFEANIHQRDDLSVIQKLSYLLSLLRGEPARVVSSFAITAENYADIIKILQQQYGNKGQIIDLNFKRILDMKPVASVAQIFELKNLITELSINLRNLKNLGIDINHCSPILNTKIKQLIPADLLLLYERQKSKEEEPSTEDLVAFLQMEINHRERITPILDPKAPIFKPRNITNTPQWRPPVRQTPTFLPRARLPQPRMWRPPVTPYQPIHQSPRPGVFPTDTDKSNIICFKCGRAGHLARECQSK